jgi:molybdopterin-guanine dinucleotide biosynthesis protein A
MKLEVCILAGGLSTRMGRDKAQLRLGRRRMLSIVRETAAKLGLPVRIIRRDAVGRCGPLGGVLTGMKTTRAGAVLFLACDMPLVSAALLERILRASRSGATSVFASHASQIGFPFLLPVSALPAVQSRIERRAFSIHPLATELKSRLVAVPARSCELMNVNTPADAIVVGRIVSQAPARIRPHGVPTRSRRE